MFSVACVLDNITCSLSIIQQKEKGDTCLNNM